MEVSKSIFWVFGVTRLGIEPGCPWPMANTLPTVPMAGYRDPAEFVDVQLKMIQNRKSIYEVHSIGFQPFFFVWAFKIVVDPWKFSILLLYILRGDGSTSMISALNEQLQQELE